MYKLIVALSTLLNSHQELKDFAISPKFNLKNHVQNIPKGESPELDQVVSECLTLINLGRNSQNPTSVDNENMKDTKNNQ